MGDFSQCSEPESHEHSELELQVLPPCTRRRGPGWGADSAVLPRVGHVSMFATGDAGTDQLTPQCHFLRDTHPHGAVGSVFWLVCVTPNMKAVSLTTDKFLQEPFQSISEAYLLQSDAWRRGSCHTCSHGTRRKHTPATARAGNTNRQRDLQPVSTSSLSAAEVMSTFKNET